jgi:hypothetical protein
MALGLQVPEPVQLTDSLEEELPGQLVRGGDPEADFRHARHQPGVLARAFVEDLPVHGVSRVDGLGVVG